MITTDAVVPGAPAAGAIDIDSTDKGCRHAAWDGVGVSAGTGDTVGVGEGSGLAAGVGLAGAGAG
ncbi:MAG TPA: hypothetical protein VM754_00100, partial [Actinomycetota bacterium]|nr:hypothetical protein [Actinomycetota bacterium]